MLTINKRHITGIETVAGDVTTRMSDYLNDRQTRRGERLGAALHSIFEAMAIDYELAQLPPSGYFPAGMGQFLSLDTTSLSYVRVVRVGNDGGLEWVKVEQNQIQIGSESEAAGTYSVDEYSPKNKQHRKLAIACISAVQDATPF